jgi:hypothetical protein
MNVILQAFSPSRSATPVPKLLFSLKSTTYLLSRKFQHSLQNQEAATFAGKIARLPVAPDK